jgi:hypothetical protein
VSKAKVIAVPSQVADQTLLRAFVDSELRQVTKAARPEPVRCLATRATAHGAYERMITSPTSFWVAVREPFLQHDLTRNDVREVIRRGLERTSGSYRLLAELFNLAPADYEGFLTFLQEYECDVCILPLSSVQRHQQTAIGGVA